MNFFIVINQRLCQKYKFYFFFMRKYFITVTLAFFISNQGQASALKVSYIFKVFGTQSCLMVAQQFDQVTYVCEEYNNFQDSKSVFMTSDFKFFPIMLLRQLNFGILSVYSYFTFVTKKKLQFSLNCSFYCSLVKEG